jgi:hypothetical protein
MRKDPQRFIIGSGFAEPCPYGDWVRYGEWQKINEENQKLRKQLGMRSNPKYGATKTIVYDCWKQGMTVRQIQEKYNWTQNNIYNAGNRMGIKFKSLKTEIPANK